MSAYQTRDLSKDEPIEINFGGVKVLAPSCANEVITPLKETFENISLLNTGNASVQATLKTLEDYPTFVSK